MKVKEKLANVTKQIDLACQRANRDPKEVKLIAVTKYVSVDRAIEAFKAGVVHLGENRDEGLEEKWQALKDKPTWHFIGSLQSRKVKDIIDKVDYIHSLDRLSLAKEINKRASKPIRCLVQVNISGEESKHGLIPDQLIPFIKDLHEFPNIHVAGLMTMAPYTDDQETIRTCFKGLKQCQLEVQSLQKPYATCEELSMGMSNDFEIAVEEGATMVRIGTALVGEEDEEVGET
ncbi:YggS family pyridoxal phosphate-dependent enzyme [Cytobacillus spongiae]|jgi:pyridoxal phosphate enzyme (YggS family)|uniref:YggS family pyridoxal phosphate-dependent enzyme n=1 Tax=Cytobacillus spongiae TaxID=2901381 RepID=UPI001F337BD6|nr:YggS family pyridoxal phosphate-dependent enzyme [Cytobacillus spongiae]UII57334.1 YggS family pyridoxal phosphate-dependent enzyme [Cytobacillus spongiae]